MADLTKNFSSSSKPNKRRVRGPTLMTQIDKVHQTGTSDDNGSPSPPSRHELWKRARQKKGGEYTSKSTQVVAEKIDSLVEEAEKGVFVLDGRNDILTAAIGTSEHGGRVRGVGKHHKQSTYFGRSSSRQGQYIDVNEQFAKFSSELEERLRADFDQKLVENRKMMQQYFMETLKSISLSQSTDNNKCIEKMEVVDSSGKGSCSAAKESTKYVEVDDVQRLLLMVLKMADTHLEIELSHCQSITNFYMSAKFIRELLVGFNWLDVSILQVWCTYIHRVCIDSSTSEIYGIMDPAMCIYVDNAKKSQAEVKNYITKKLREENRVCHLLPLIHGRHWQLIVICPKDNIVVVFCSLHREIDAITKKIVTAAFGVHQMANGNRKNATWLHPNTRQQHNSNDCGYYVMKNMFDIVSANIIESWMQVFDDSTEITQDDLYDLRLRWAKCFFELYKV
ncbi:uncharacterized protein LOC131646975 [Vicia villosa]|uniref:uncharacterized protein LOC131646975 n=1 Tax=Vicia villosa TaxID=3911 RepID=UPI00273A96AD|nr:uncharacterized protein LOC131646975 [Vicia villosa]